MTAISIPAWDKRFETSQSRKVDSITWTPLRHSFVSLLRTHPLEVAAAAIHIVVLAASMPKRGILNDGARDLTLDDIQRYVDSDRWVLEKALTALGVGYQSAGSDYQSSGSGYHSTTERGKEGRKEEREGGEGRKEPSSSSPASPAKLDRVGSDDVASVWAHYHSYHPRSKLDDKRRKLIRRSLKDGWTPAELCEAIDGNHRSPFHCGQNDNGQKHNGIDLILRSADYVQKFIDLARNGTVGAVARPQNIAAGQAWLNRHRENEE